MEIKIIGKSVVPDRIVLYENDLGAKNLVFSSSKVNDGVNLEVLSAYLEIEREEGVSDRFLLDKTLVGDIIYFTLPINLALTETADILSSQIVFENQEKTLSYRSKVFYIEVKYSVDGVSSYEQLAPTVISQLESKMDKAVTDCETIKSEIELTKDEFESNVEGTSNKIKEEVISQMNDVLKDEIESSMEETSTKIKEEVLSQVNNVLVDDALSTESENPVQNKIITEKINEITIKVDDTLSAESENPVQNKVVTEALKNKLESEDLTNYVKNTDYATASNAGIVRTNLGYGTQIYGDGYVATSRAGGQEINAKTNNFKPIVPMNLNYAVMKALTEPTVGGTQFPANWTDEDKALARQTIGATIIYKHIITGKIISTGDDFDFVKIVFYSINKEQVDFVVYGEDNSSVVLYINDAEGIISPPYCVAGVNANTAELITPSLDYFKSSGKYSYVLWLSSNMDWNGEYTSNTLVDEVVGV